MTNYDREIAVPPNAQRSVRGTVAVADNNVDAFNCVLSVKVNPIEITENLFFAIFGQKDTDDFTMSLQLKLQPTWTLYLFKVSFSLYMLVSVIVLINLLIAMMSDTYQSIQSQSDIEWKYGLSKLIRKMQKTRTAPSPFNLVTSWIAYLGKAYQGRISKGRWTGMMHAFVVPRNLARQPFVQGFEVSTSRGRDSINFPFLERNSLGSQLSLGDAPRIDTVVDWENVRRKYRVRFGDETEKPPRDDPSTLDHVL